MEKGTKTYQLNEKIKNLPKMLEYEKFCKKFKEQLEFIYYEIINKHTSKSYEEFTKFAFDNS